MPNVQRFRVNAGEDITLTFFARDDSNVPQDLTGRQVTLFVKGVGNKAATTLSPSAGSFAVRLKPFDVEAETRKGFRYKASLHGPHRYDCLLDDGSLSFVNNSQGGLQFVNGGGLQFVNNSGGILQFVNGGAEPLDFFNSIGGTGSLQFVNNWDEPLDFFNAAANGTGGLQFVNNDGDPLNFVNDHANDVRVVTSGKMYIGQPVRR